MPETDYCCPSCEGGFPKPADECPWCGEVMDGRSGPDIGPPVGDIVRTAPDSRTTRRSTFKPEIDPDGIADRIGDVPEEDAGDFVIGVGELSTAELVQEISNASGPRFERASDRLDDGGES